MEFYVIAAYALDNPPCFLQKKIDENVKMYVLPGCCSHGTSYVRRSLPLTCLLSFPLEVSSIVWHVLRAYHWQLNVVDSRLVQVWLAV